MNNHNLEAEKNILGSILVDPDSLLAVSDYVGTEDFYHSGHRLIFNAVLDLYQLGEGIDLISVIDRLRQRGTINEAGGESYVSTLAAEVVTSANVKYHAKLVKNKSILRRTGRWATEIANESCNGIEDVNAWLSKVERDLIDISANITGKTSPYAKDILQSVEQFWEDVRQGKKVHIPTNDFLEDAIPGYYPKHLWMIGGYTSVGKSTLLAQLMVDIAVQGGKTLLFSMEESREEKLMRLIANVADVHFKKLITGKISGFESDVDIAKKQIQKWTPIIYDDVYTMDEIRLKTKKHKMQDGIDVVCIDYIQNLKGPETLYERMSDASAKLFAMAKELNVTVIVLSQIDNESARKESNIIGLKGAGELAAAAHIVLWLKRVKGENKERYLDCAIRKNRAFGQTGNIRLIFSDKWTQIERRSKLL